MPEQPGIIRPPDIFYEKQRMAGSQANQTISAQTNVTYLTTRIEASPRGILLYMRGSNGVPLKHPSKGWPTPEAMWNCNIVKQVIMGLLFCLASPSGALVLLGFSVTPWKWKIKWLNNALFRLARIPMWTLETSYFKEEIWSTSAQELKKAIYLMMFNLGLTHDLFDYGFETTHTIAHVWSKALAFLVEIDNAYRYRLQDIFSETNKEKLLANPRKELRRLVGIFIERQSESEVMNRKVRMLGQILSLVLLIPKIRRAFLKTVQEIDITALGLDEADRYHVLCRDGYNFLGRSYEDRQKEWVAIHDGNPPEPVIYQLN